MASISIADFTDDESDSADIYDESTDENHDETSDASISLKDNRSKSDVIHESFDESDNEADLKPKKNKNMIIESDSDDEQLQINDVSVGSSSDQSLHTIYNISLDVDAPKTNNSRISSDFHFGRNKKIINSTVLHDNSPSSPKKLGHLPNNSTNNFSSPICSNKKATDINNSVGQSKSFKAEFIKEAMLTPRTVKQIIPDISDDDDDDSDIIEVSSDENITVPPKFNKTVVRQTTLDAHVIKQSPKVQKQLDYNKEKIDSPNVSDVLEVSSSELQVQKEKVRSIERDLMHSKNMLRTINIQALPDKGKLLYEKYNQLERNLKEESAKLSLMLVTKDDSKSSIKDELRNLSWNDIQIGASAVQPKTFGKQAMATYNAQKAVTMDRLEQLHGSLKGCPTEDIHAEDPKGLKVELMPHQKRALAWLMWRENQTPSGGILADDMGLGKTLTMISLMLKTLEIEDTDEEEQEIDENNPRSAKKKYNGGTLVVCPASLINQWSGELERRAKRGLASYQIYHGPKRETKPKRLAEHDMVITTYAIINNESEKNGAVFRVKWRRIVLDEAHQVRNHKSQTSAAVCQLSAKSRWALTGTPIHNKEEDMYALLKFLRCTPFDDLQVWKRWVGNKSTGGQERLHTVISSLMLRRTKAELMEKGALKCLPERKWELIPINLTKNEMDVYQKVLIFSRTLFSQFLHQRAEKNQDMADLKFTQAPSDPNGEYFKMRQKLLKLNKVKDVSQHEILVLLLRLRQICSHPTLITAMLQKDELNGAGLEEDEESEELNLLDQLNKLNIDDDEYNETIGGAAAVGQVEEDGEEEKGLKVGSKGYLNPANPVFSDKFASSKIRALLKLLKENIMETDDKAIIVSQWPTLLRLVAYHLKEAGIVYDQLDGGVPVNKRMVMVDSFNDPNHKIKVLLLSLTAGGVGLNLVGGNHLLLLDLHWNPQLENQAQDRIYRVGQTKPVYVYKFMASDTIEERIKALQDNKLGMAEAMLTGTKQIITNKLSLQDLKMLFDM